MESPGTIGRGTIGVLFAFTDQSVAKEGVKRQFTGNEFFTKYRNAAGFWEDVNWEGPSSGTNAGYNSTGGSLNTNGRTPSIKIDQSTPGWDTPV